MVIPPQAARSTVGPADKEVMDSEEIKATRVPEPKAAPSKRAQALEMLTFLFLIAPSLVFSFIAVRGGSLSFVLTAWATLLRDLALVCLILYFLWRNGEPLQQIGWTVADWSREVLVGLLLFPPLFYGAAILESSLNYVGLSSPKLAPSSLVPGRSLSHTALAFFLVLIVAIAEETLFRGYLILRLRAVAGGTVAAVVLSAAIFSFGHGYEGSAGVVTVGFMGLYFAIVYVWRKSLIAPMVMHFMQDFLVVILIPLVRGR